jgi:hypothetical protein
MEDTHRNGCVENCDKSLGQSLSAEPSTICGFLGELSILLLRLITPRHLMSNVSIGIYVMKFRDSQRNNPRLETANVLLKCVKNCGLKLVSLQ